MRLLALASRWRAERRRKALLESSLELLLGGGAFLCAEALLDQAFSLPQAARWGALAAAGAAAAALVARAAALCLRPDWRRIMAAAQARFPEVAPQLAAAWELREASPPHTSESLRRAHLEQTEALLARLPDEPVFRPALTPAAKRCAAAFAAACLALPWLWRSPSWERVFAPWRDVPLERYVSLSPGTSQVAWGRPAAVEARWDAAGALGRGASALRLWVKGPDGWRAVRWDKESAGRASFAIDEVSEPFVYRLSWRDLRSGVYRLTPVAPPRLESLRARIHGADESVVVLDASQPLTVMRGSWLSVIGRPNQELAHAALRLSSLPGEIALQRERDGELSATFQLREDASLRLDLETPDGRRDPEPAVFALRAAADEPPRVELVSPTQPLQAAPDDVLPVSYSARDDGGVAAISLLIKPAGGTEREVPLRRFDAAKKEFLGDHPWDLSGLPLGKVSFRLKALDNAAPPQAGYSQKGELELVDFAALHARAEADWLKAEESLGRLAEAEKALSAELGRPAGAPEAQLASLPKQWREAVEDFSALARSMQDDAYANPGLSEASRRAASDLARAQRDDLPPALEAARGKERAAARAAHERLARRADAARRLLAEGRKLQGMQDLFSNAGRMSQASSALESELESAAERAKAVSPEDRRRLDAALAKLQKQMESLSKALASLPKADAATEASARESIELPVESARRQADRLAEALARGDYAAAADAARRLSDDLARIERALASAAAGSPSASSARRGSEEAARLQQSWSQALDAQTRAVESERRLEQGSVQNRLAAERELLARLAREHAVQVSSAAALGADMRADVMAWMRAVQGELEAGKVARAPELLRAATDALRRLPARPSASAAYRALASGEESILKRLAAGPPSTAPPSAEQRAAAAREQGAALGKAGQLQRGLESFAERGGTLPDGTLRRLEQAQAEQRRAQSDADGGDAPGALKHGQSALDLLSQGAQQMAESAGEEGSIESGMGKPFERPGTVVRVLRSGGAGTGAQLGFVPLPSAKDYAPPRELRQQLEKSLRERRPASYDKVIKEYFKRVAQ